MNLQVLVKSLVIVQKVELSAPNQELVGNSIVDLQPASFILHFVRLYPDRSTGKLPAFPTKAPEKIGANYASFRRKYAGFRQHMKIQTSSAE